ncbi:MAG TPA: Uma2 family endonuclease [Tepidisphaeraceae bacterium]|nr:Uma2 family endonuclease [Tepidisphaeraceae bacterium]
MSRSTLQRHAAAASTGPMSYEEFLATDFENPKVEWINGRAIVMSPSNRQHHGVNRFLGSLLFIFVEERQLGVVMEETFQMKTGPDLPGREPDILFVSNAHRKRLKKTYLDGPADLAVEIISPDSVARDRGEKYQEYEKGGVREYWLIDPERKSAEFYVLNKRGTYQPATLGADGIFHSTVLKGVWIKVAWLWQTPLPSKISILREWGLI